MIQLGEPLNRKKTIKCPSCGDRVLYVLHDRKAGERLRRHDVRFLQPTTVKNPLYCSKCDSPWINKSTGRIICLGVPKAVRDALKYDCKASNIKPSELSIASLDDRWMVKRKMTDKEKIERLEDIQFFKKQLRTVGDNKDKPSELTGCKCSKDKDCNAIPLKDGFYTADRGERYFLIQNGMYIPQFQPITGPGLPEMLKDTKAKKRTGYKADSIIIDECKPLTRRQIKEANEALNKLNAKKPTKKTVENKNLLLHGKGKKLSDFVTGLDGFCTIGKKR